MKYEDLVKMSVKELKDRPERPEHTGAGGSRKRP